MTYKLAKTSQDADPYFGAVSLLLDGQDFEDKSLNRKTVTKSGIDITTEAKWHGQSYKTKNTYRPIITIEDSDNDFDFGSGDFTVEFWMRPSYISSANQSYVLFSAGAVYIDFRGHQLRCNATGISMISTGLFATVSGSSGIWQHVAFVRNGNTFTPYLDGVAGNTATSSGSLASISNIYIGANGTGTPYKFYGNIQDIRITKGVARYTANFTPPTQPFFGAINPDQDRYFYATSLLLHGDGTNGSTTIVDSSGDPKTITVNGDAQISTAESKFGGSSLKFDGTGDYLDAGTEDGYGFDQQDFTIECWVWRNGTLVDNTGLVCTGTSNASGSWQLGFYSDKINFQEGPNQLFRSSNVSPNQTWFHVAVTRESGTFKLFIDGVLDKTSSVAQNLNNRPLKVGINRAVNKPFNGYIDDLRITKGVARYTSNFTPPTKAFPNY